MYGYSLELHQHHRGLDPLRRLGTKVDLRELLVAHTAEESELSAEDEAAGADASPSAGEVAQAA